MKKISKEVKIGIASIVALGILIYGINYLKGINMFKPTNYYYVHFENVNGLSKSSPVFADGVRVGIVRDIHYDFDAPENVYIEIETETDLRIPQGSSAELIADMLGGLKMNLLLAANPREKCQPGDTLMGMASNGMMDQLSKMMPQIEQMLPKLDSILTSLNTVLADPAIPATLHSLQHTTANLEKTSKHLNSLMENDVPQLTAKLNTLGDNFIAISDNLKQIDYKKLAGDIDNTLLSVKAFTDKLDKTDNTVGLLLNDPKLYNNLTETAGNAASLLKDLEEHPKRYVHFSLFGKKDKK